MRFAVCMFASRRTLLLQLAAFCQVVYSATVQATLTAFITHKEF